MNLRILYVLVGAVLLAPGALAADEPSLRSEKAHPDMAPSKPRRVRTSTSTSGCRRSCERWASTLAP